MKRDDIIFDIIEKEHQRQLKGIELIASENFVSDQGIGNISKSIVYDNINSDGSTGVSPIIFRRRDSALSFSFGFIL